MLHVLTGEDDFSIRQTIADIKKSIGEATVLEANTTLLSGQQVTPDLLRHACETVPFLAEKRLVIVEGLLSRFEPRARPSRKKSENVSTQQEEWKLMLDSVRHVPDFAVLVLVDGRIGNRNPMLPELAKFAQVKTFPLLKDAGLRQWMGKRVAGAGAAISPQAVDLLVRFIGSNLWLMANEVDKLVSYAAGRRIEEKDVREVVSYAQEASVFSMVDAILEGRAGVAQELLQQLLGQGAAPAYLLVMLARQVQLIFRMKELKNQGKTRNDIQAKLGLSSDFVIRKVIAQSDRYSSGRLKEVYHKLLEADLSVKTGKYEGDLALNLLVAELGQRSPVSRG